MISSTLRMECVASWPWNRKMESGLNACWWKSKDPQSTSWTMRAKRLSRGSPSDLSVTQQPLQATTRRKCTITSSSTSSATPVWTIRLPRRQKCTSSNASTSKLVIWLKFSSVVRRLPRRAIPDRNCGRIWKSIITFRPMRMLTQTLTEKTKWQWIR